MKTFYKFIGIYIAFLLQSLFFQNLRIFSCSLDIMLALLVMFSVSLEFVPAALLGAFAGLLIDVMYEEVFGINLLLYMFLALIVSLATDRKNENSPLIMGWIAFISIAAFEIVVAIFKSVTTTPMTLGTLCANIFVKGIFASVFLLVLVLAIQNKKKKKADKKQISEEEATV